jgi:hypothetical protein
MDSMMALLGDIAMRGVNAQKILELDKKSNRRNLVILGKLGVIQDMFLTV